MVISYFTNLPAQGLLLHCRPGFESEACAEISAMAASLEIKGLATAQAASGYAQYQCAAPDACKLIQQRFQQLIFIRQWAVGRFVALPEADRISVLAEHLAAYPVVGSLWFEVLDTNEGKALATFCKKFAPLLRQVLLRSGQLVEVPERSRLLLTFKSSREVFLGLALPQNSATWPMGIARLRFPRAAPSRSTLKLEEAWHHFIPAQQWDKRLAPGMRAVDLGAAPGGWTWQLVARQMQVTAIDNGPMARSLLDSGLVLHQRTDGFAFTPKRPVDWMVCDIVEKPARTAALLARWLAAGWCQEAVVNLKLPMKQRYATVIELLDRIAQGAEQGKARYRIGCKQLYHDREEVTCHVQRLEAKARS